MNQAGKVTKDDENRAMLSALKQQASFMLEQIAALEAGDAKPKTKPKVETPKADVLPDPPAPPPRLTFRERIQAALSKSSLDIPELARATSSTKDKVTRELQTLRAEGLVFNVGYEDSPVWTWRVGENAEPSVINAAVQRLISERPMYMTDLIRATGATYRQVDAAIIQVRRYPPEGMHVVDMSPSVGWKPHGRAKMYFLAPEQLRDASLAKKSEAKAKSGPKK